ncbi:MAG: ABC transporter permease subunit [Bryobacterales bacterium]|nr:ABC transporter permease subunit [Bryobacterales bacterium]
MVLLAYAGLSAIPDAYYQAARIDGASRWAVFRYIQLPKMKRVLTIAVLLRFMDSFMIYTEALVLTGGGPGNSTTLLFDRPGARWRVGQFDLGPAAAISLIYFLIILLFCFVLYNWMQRLGQPPRGGRSHERCDDLRSALFLHRLHRLSCCCRSTGCSTCRSRPRTRSSAASRCWPQHFTLRQLQHDLHRSDLVLGLHQLADLRVMNTVISVTVALPAAYAFSRYRFLGDKHLFFWLLTNRMAPPAVFALPFFQLYSAIGLFDTHIAVALAHCLFNIPLAVWILEGFMSGVPKELDETAYVDGYTLPALLPHASSCRLIAAGIGVAAFFCFMFSWVELLLAKHADLGRRQADRGDHDPHRQRQRLRTGPAGRGRRADHHPRRHRDLVRAQLHRQGLCPGEGVMAHPQHFEQFPGGVDRSGT